MISIIDLGIGNIGSVVKAINYLKYKHEVIDTPDKLSATQKIILPGVGNFAAASKKLEKTGFKSAIYQKVIKEKKPILGICVGMQLLAECGEEGIDNNQTSPGLGFFPAVVKKINPIDPSLHIPHMGWNNLQYKQLALFKGIDKESCFYFVHSYAMQLKEQSTGIKTAHFNYGGDFIGYVNKDHIHGVQFHPEKSQQVGLALLNNFIQAQ